MSATLRSVQRVLQSHRTLEGGGFMVQRAFPTPALREFDPFLLLDEMGPADLAPGEAKGAPDHPHRGFETVTYMLAGGMNHKDSRGHAGSLRPGDVQWMTAGAGVVHSEMPSTEMLERGGRMHGFQLWVNLPRRDKLIKPHYQEIKSEEIPTATSVDGRTLVKIIAGEALGKKAVIATKTPIVYLHFTIKPSGQIHQLVPKDFNAFAYVVSGEGLFGRADEKAAAGRAVLFAGDGDHIALANASSSSLPLEVLLIAGAPLNEPVVRYGPFVMNTESEIEQAIADYQSGRMGEIGTNASSTL